MANLAPTTTPVVNHSGCIRAVRDEVARLSPSLFVTLAFNRATTLESALRSLDHLHARIERKLLGHDWQKRVGRRSRFIAVAENVESNLHLHLLVSPADGQWWQFCKLAVRFWPEPGDVDVQPVDNARAAADYMLKQTRLDTFDRIQFSKGY